MIAISDERRTWLFRFSAVSCAFALLLAPIAARSSRDLVPADDGFVLPTAVPTVAPRLPDRALTAARNPFEPPVVDDEPLPSIALRALVRGARPFALVEVAGETRPIGIGQPLFGSRVVALDRFGLRLADGRAVAFRSVVP